MALIKCTECGNMVSDKADRCPHCGCPVSIILGESEKAPENPPVKEPAQRPAPAPAPKASVTAAPVAEPPISKPPAETPDAQAAHDKKVQEGFIFTMCLVVLCIIGVVATSSNQPVPAKSPTTPTTQTSGHAAKRTTSSSSSSSSPSGSSSTTNTARHSDDDAFYCAKLIVEDYLKAPSTAKFCKQSDATVTHLGNGEYMVTGWVDAENSYGAMIRSDFVVTYTATEKGFKNGNAIIG